MLWLSKCNFYTHITGYDSNRSLQGGSTAGKEGIDVSSALKLISHEEGRKISGKAHSVVKDAYFAYLLLRHARIRDLMIKVYKLSVRLLCNLCARVCITVVFVHFELLSID